MAGFPTPGPYRGEHEHRFVVFGCIFTRKISQTRWKFSDEVKIKNIKILFARVMHIISLEYPPAGGRRGSSVYEQSYNWRGQQVSRFKGFKLDKGEERLDVLSKCSTPGGSSDFVREYYPLHIQNAHQDDYMPISRDISQRTLLC